MRHTAGALTPGAPAVLVRGEAAEQRRRVADSQRLQGVAQRGRPARRRNGTASGLDRRGEVGVKAAGRAAPGEVSLLIFQRLPAGSGSSATRPCFVAGPIVERHGRL